MSLQPQETPGCTKTEPKIIKQSCCWAWLHVREASVLCTAIKEKERICTKSKWEIFTLFISITSSKEHDFSFFKPHFHLDWKGKLSHPRLTSSEVKLCLWSISGYGAPWLWWQNTQTLLRHWAGRSKSPHARGADTGLSASRDPPRIGKPAGGNCQISECFNKHLTSLCPLCHPTLSQSSPQTLAGSALCHRCTNSSQ